MRIWSIWPPGTNCTSTKVAKVMPMKVGIISSSRRTT
jgi:hypothetical protein